MNTFLYKLTSSLKWTLNWFFVQWHLIFWFWCWPAPSTACVNWNLKKSGDTNLFFSSFVVTFQFLADAVAWNGLNTVPVLCNRSPIRPESLNSGVVTPSAKLAVSTDVPVSVLLLTHANPSVLQAASLLGATNGANQYECFPCVMPGATQSVHASWLTLYMYVCVRDAKEQKPPAACRCHLGAAANSFEYPCLPLLS